MSKNNPKYWLLADENIPKVAECFGDLAQIHTAHGRTISSGDLTDIDLLLVRSITQVNRQLLHHSKLKMLGTATIGTDHIDRNELRRRGIHFAYAPASNAQSVVEYVLSAIAYRLNLHRQSASSISVGIIGCGQIGSRLNKILKQLNIKTLCCDPPLQQQSNSTEQWASLSQISQCDIITCHVPLNRDGEHPTFHLIDQKFMSRMKPGSLLINSSRGAVVDNLALKQMLSDGHIEAVLDVWENEPNIDLELMQKLLLATPHIAGYATEAKIRGTYMLYQAFCQHFKQPQTISFAQLLPRPPKSIRFANAQQWQQNCHRYYDIKADDQQMRHQLKQSPDRFDWLRKNYQNHHEFLSLD